MLLQAQQIARIFAGEYLFKQLHIEIQETSKIALVGRNGTGKSTFLKIIAGIDAPDEGSISKQKEARIGYLSQQTNFESTRTVWDEMEQAFAALLQTEKRLRQLEQQISETNAEDEQYQQLLEQYASLEHQFQINDGYQYEAEIRSVLQGFGFDSSFYDRSITTLSGGQKTRLALAKLLLEKPELLILDEPTNHLDIETLSWLEGYLAHYKGALLIVSHDRYFLDKVVNEVYEIRSHKIFHYKGNYSAYLDQKAALLEQEEKAYQKQQEKIQHLEEFIQKNIARASTTKRAQSRQKQLAKMEQLDRPQTKEKSAKMLFSVEHTSGNEVLHLENGAIGYTEPLCENINISLRRQEAIALIGPNGIGKSTLLKTIIRQLPLLAGEMRFGTNVTIGYYDQEQKQLISQKTVLAELWDDHPLTPEKDIRTILGSFLFSGEEVEKTVSMLSGGEKARLALAKLSMEHRNFLVLDEPTNHLDIDSKEMLEQALIDYPGTLLFVSHDRYFINRIATKVVELSADGSRMYHGDYDYYLEKKQEEAEMKALALQNQEQKASTSQSEQKPTAAKQHYQQTKEQQKARRKIERQIQELETQLQTLEEAIAHLQEEMSQPVVLQDHEALQDLHEQLTNLEAQQEEAFTKWEVASLELEALDEEKS